MPKSKVICERGDVVSPDIEMDVIAKEPTKSALQKKKSFAEIVTENTINRVSSVHMLEDDTGDIPPTGKPPLNGQKSIAKLNGPDVHHRWVFANDSNRNHGSHSKYDFSDNVVTTSRYTWWNFIPKNLFEQFHRVANCYFLFITILSYIPQITTLNPITNIFPLLFVLGVTLCKDGKEDYNRHTNDRAMNALPCRVIRDNDAVFVEWKDILVGDICEVRDGEWFCADMVLLGSILTEEPGEEARNELGTCFIETSNLDGETNLKIRQALIETNYICSVEDAWSFKGMVFCDGPSSKLHEFKGTLFLEEPTKDSSVKFSLTPNQLMLRGTRLMNTAKIYGLVTHTGFESKIVMNANRDMIYKRSRLERTMNYLVWIIFACLFICCFIAALGCGIWSALYAQQNWYIDSTNSVSANAFDSSNNFLVALQAFFSYIILLNTFIPISLYVTIEIIKLIVGYWVNLDAEMYCEELDKTAQCLNSSLTEELGQVQYVLSDKTGTLTQNKMELIKVSLNGSWYGTGVTEIEIAKAKLSGITLKPYQRNLDSDCNVGGDHPPEDPDFEFYDPFLNNCRFLLDSRESHKDAIMNFFVAVAICHTVIPEHLQNGHIKYNAASPDDGALVRACKNLGFMFKKRHTLKNDLEELVLSIPVLKSSSAVASTSSSSYDWDSVDCTYTVLATIDFSSTRKRMTVIVRCPDGKIRAYIKGADNVIIDRLYDQASSVVSKTKKHINDFADQGLRTMAVAVAVLDGAYFARSEVVEIFGPNASFETWDSMYRSAKMQMVKREEQMDAVGDLIERGFTLLGATAIEDKLQVDVGKTLESLSDAGLQTWVLTGDKVGTAIMIAYACSLLTPDMEIFKILGSESHVIKNEKDEEITVERKYKAREIIGHIRDAYSQRKGRSVHINPAALVIDGDALRKIGFGFDEGEKLRLTRDQRRQFTAWMNEFTDLGSLLKAVVCCRVSPSQKSDICSVVKRNMGKIVLGIGDGANDVGMILAAHIGVGIRGKEGSAAVAASDFAICQFKDLNRLLLIHGRWTYRRLSVVVCYFFYKNLTFTLTLFWFAFYCSFSGAKVYDDWYQSLYNTLFTSLPVFVMGFFDQDVGSRTSIKFPKLYLIGQKNDLFNFRVIMQWALEGVIHSLIIYFTTVAQLYLAIYNPSGMPCPEREIGFIMYSSVILVVSIRLMFEFCHWNYIVYIVFAISILGWLLLALGYSAIPPGTMSQSNIPAESYWVAENAMSPALTWLSCLWVTSACCLILSYASKSIQIIFFPTVVDVAREIELIPRLNVETKTFVENLKTPTPTSLDRAGYSVENLHEDSVTLDIGAQADYVQFKSQVAKMEALRSRSKPSTTKLSIADDDDSSTMPDCDRYFFSNNEVDNVSSSRK